MWAHLCFGKHPRIQAQSTVFDHRQCASEPHIPPTSYHTDTLLGEPSGHCKGHTVQKGAFPKHGGGARSHEAILHVASRSTRTDSPFPLNTYTGTISMPKIWQTTCCINRRYPACGRWARPEPPLPRHRCCGIVPVLPTGTTGGFLMIFCMRMT